MASVAALRRSYPRTISRETTGDLPSWPVVWLFVGIPLWWVLGVGGFVWQIFALPMALGLFMKRDVRCPRGFGIWLLFLFWMCVSATQLHGTARIAAYAYRGSLYLSATVLLLYVFNMSRERFTNERAFAVLAAAWIATVAGGFAGLVASHVQFRSVAEVVLPHSLTSIPFIKSIVHPRIADVTHLLGYPVARPIAPYNYTNQWGANLALLTPFFLLDLRRRSAERRALVRWLLLLAAIVPVVISLNRGLWISVSVGLLYVALRFTVGGNRQARRILAVSLLAVIGLGVLSPLGQVVSDRLAHPNTKARQSLYQSAEQHALDSPVFGYGAPIESSDSGPSVGTHGQLWTVLISHGVIGAGFFVGWLLFAFADTWKTTPSLLWMNAVILIALSQLPYYNMLPTQLHVVVVAVALLGRQAQAPAPAPDLETDPARWPQ